MESASHMIIEVVIATAEMSSSNSDGDMHMADKFLKSKYCSYRSVLTAGI